MTKYNELKTKKSKIEFLKGKLSTDQRWVCRAVTTIFEYQTADEQRSEMTSYHNGVGFSGADAEILSSFAKQINRGRSMSQKQLAILFKKMPKYARQLMVIADQKAAEKEAAEEAASDEAEMNRLVQDAERKSEEAGAWASAR